MTFDGKTLVYTIDFEMDGQAGTITVTAVKEGDDSLKGRWSLTGPNNEEVAGDSWQATRAKTAE